MKILNSILDTLLPQFCLNCHREGELICLDCLSLIGVNEFVYCPFCQKPTRVFEKGTCPQHSQKFLHGLFCPADFGQALVKKLIHNFKYKPYLKTLSSSLSFLIIAHFQLSGKQMIFQDVENSCFLPVPLFSKKEKDRGYNQSALLAKALAKRYSLPVLENCLLRIKKTKTQTNLKKEGRLANVAGAFVIKNPELISGKKIFLVDDVFTTGSTMVECAKTLKIAGARQVWGIAFAREMMK